MKRLEYVANLHKLSPADLKKEITSLENKLQEARVAVAFGKSKKMSEIRLLKRQLAQCLTIGNQKIRAASKDGEKV